MKLLTLICSIGFGLAPSLVAADQPNVVLILADDLGIGDCSVYNADSKIRTPNIDRLAREGMLFTDAHAAGGICVPSRYGLLTGQYAFRTWDRYPPRAPSIKDPRQVTIASLLKNNGYDTAMVGKWHLGIGIDNQNKGKIRHSPVEFGFDYFFGMNQSLDTQPYYQPYYYVEGDRMVAAPTGHTRGQQGDPAKVSKPSIQGPMWREGAIAPGFVHEECLPLFTSKATDYLKTRSAEPDDKPFFLFLSFAAPHAPWLPLPKFRGTSGAGDYGDFVTQVDDCVRQVTETLEQRGLADNTLVIFTSDNGPLWFPEDTERYGHRSAGKYRGWKGALYEGGHRMPFIARWPAKIKAESTSNHLVNFTDVMATFAELAGTRMPAGAGPDSFSFLPHLVGKGATGPVRTNSMHENHGGASLALRQGDWKLRLPPKSCLVVNGSISPDSVNDYKRLKLYNLRDDPSETKNLAMQHPDKVKELFTVLKADVERGRARSKRMAEPSSGNNNAGTANANSVTSAGSVDHPIRKQTRTRRKKQR